MQINSARATITRGGRYKLCLFMGHGVYIYIYISLVPPRNFRDVHGDDFIRLRWFYGAGCSRKREIRPRELSKTFIFFFLRFEWKNAVRICIYLENIFELFARSIFHGVCTNYGIFELLLLLLFYFYEMTLYHFSIQIYVTKIGEIQSYNVNKLIKIKSRIPLLFHYYSRLNNYKILTNYLIS